MSLSHLETDFEEKDEDEFSQIIIDEAQDFGVMVYYVMKQVLDTCYFTIMGDVSQNIRYETGMNDWKDLKKVLFQKSRTAFTFWQKATEIPSKFPNMQGKSWKKPPWAVTKYSLLSATGRKSRYIEKKGTHWKPC